MTKLRLRRSQRKKKARRSSLTLDALRRLRKNRLAMVGAFLIVSFVFMALFASVISPYDPIAQLVLVALL